MHQRPLDRRQFLASSAGAAAALSLADLAPAAARVPVRAPGDEVRVAVIGLNGRGRDHVNGFARLPNVKVVVLCDVDAKVLEKEMGRVTALGHKPEGLRDLRDVLARKDVDAISVATPNHWHALAAVWACQAGKDVYVEKPVSHSVWEGRQIVLAARKHGRIVQSGTQSRSSQAIRDGIAWVHAGNLGKILWAQGMCFKPRPSIGKVSAPTGVPDHVDYDLWCGPSPKGPLRRKSLHYDWHWVHDTGNGDLGNQGIHQMDLCRWALGEQGLPRAVRSVGGRLGYDDDGNTPNTQFVVFDYEKAPLVFEVRGLPREKAKAASWTSKDMDKVQGLDVGALLHCEGGTLRLPNYESAVAVDAQGKEVKKWQGADDHYANFIAAVRSRKASDLNADIEVGHLSSALCHFGMVSHQLGKAESAEQIGKELQASARGTEALGRMLEHLQRNEVDLSKQPLHLGAALRIDAASERCPDRKDADALLRQQYRAPFTIPDLA